MKPKRFHCMGDSRKLLSKKIYKLVKKGSSLVSCCETSPLFLSQLGDIFSFRKCWERSLYCRIKLIQLL